MIMRIVVLVLVLVSSVAAADSEVLVRGAPAIATSPAGGVDPDVARRFTEADALVRSDPSHALERVLVLYQADDPFSRAQREPAKPRALALLGVIGSRARAAGDLVLAARAYDARWIISGANIDRDAAAVLADWASREPDAGRALYLARRAHRADPGLERAAELDDDLSRNPHVTKMRLLIVASLLAFGGGLYAAHEGHDRLATGLYIASPALSLGGILLGLSGVPNHNPTSPAELPSVGDRR